MLEIEPVDFKWRGPAQRSEGVGGAVAEAMVRPAVPGVPVHLGKDSAA